MTCVEPLPLMIHPLLFRAKLHTNINQICGSYKGSQKGSWVLFLWEVASSRSGSFLNISVTLPPLFQVLYVHSNLYWQETGNIKSSFSVFNNGNYRKHWKCGDDNLTLWGVVWYFYSALLATEKLWVHFVISSRGSGWLLISYVKMLKSSKYQHWFDD